MGDVYVSAGPLNPVTTFLLLVCTTTPISAAQERFSLRELESMPVPSDLVPTGASPVGSGDFAVWSAVSGDLVLSLRSSLRAREPVGSPMYATRTSTGLAVFDGRSGSIATYSEDGARISVRELDLPGPALAATESGGDWFVWIRSREDLRSLYRVPASDPPVRVTTVPHSHPIQVASAPAGTVTTETFPPYRSVVRNVDGVAVQHFVPPPQALSMLGEDSRAVSSPLLLGDSLILQTLADLRSDRRIVIIYANDGTSTSVTALDLPLAFFAISQAGDSLFAMRSVTGRDIATYRVER